MLYACACLECRLCIACLFRIAPHYCGATLCLTSKDDQADQLDRPTDLEGKDADYQKCIEKDENPSALGDAFHDYIFDFMVSWLAA